MHVCWSLLRLLLRLFGERQELMRTLGDIQLVEDPQIMYGYQCSDILVLSYGWRTQVDLSRDPNWPQFDEIIEELQKAVSGN